MSHFCNTFFEKEIEESVFGNPPRSLKNWLYSHPFFLQLQFLPLLYAGAHDHIFVSDLPENPDPRLCLIDQDPIQGNIDMWGPSLSLHQAQIPSWEVVQQVNSKIFSFTSSPRLPGACLLTNHEEVFSWIEKTPGPKVLKTAYGTSGNGHFHIGHKKNLQSYLDRQFSHQLPIIGEIWMERLLDFSTQWHIDEKIQYVGATIFENHPNGSYLATLAGQDFGNFKWALQEHLAIAKPLLKDIQKKGFFGNLGIDAYVYQYQGKQFLQPIVEINGRKTMSFVALSFQKKHSPNRAIRFSFEKGFPYGILPQKLSVNGKEIFFSHQIRYTPI